MWDDLDGLPDFGLDEYEPVDYLASKETPTFDLHSGARRLNARCRLPQDGESVRVISYAGGFSSASVVVWIAGLYKIDDMRVTTLRVGQKEIDAMRELHDKGRLENAEFILSGIAKDNTRGGKDYGYTDFFEGVCRECGWSWRYEKNHSKVILLNTRGANTPWKRAVISTRTLKSSSFASARARIYIIFTSLGCLDDNSHDGPGVWAEAQGIYSAGVNRHNERGRGRG